MLLGAARPVSAPARARVRREKHARADGFRVPIGDPLATKLPAVQTDRSLYLRFRFEFLTHSGSFWLPAGPEYAKGCQKVAPAAHPTMKIARLGQVLFKYS